MTVYYVDSAGSNTSPYDTWAKAATAIATIAGIDAAGDSVYLASTHSESTAAAVSLAWAGTNASPVKLICGTTAAAPPTTAATSAIVASGNGAYPITCNGGVFAYGIAFKAGVGASLNAYIQLNQGSDSANQTYQECDFYLSSTSASAYIQFGSDGTLTSKSIDWGNVDVSFGNTSQYLYLGNCQFTWRGGSILGGSSAITTLFKCLGRAGNVLVSGVDLSNAAAGVNLVNVAAAQMGKIVFQNCKLPDTWSGSLTTGTPTGTGLRVEMHNCDSADTNYRYWAEDYAGSVKTDTAVYKDSGASHDGSVPLSLKMATSANAEWPSILLRQDLPPVWNSTTGASKTIAVDILHDGASAVTNADIWLEVQYFADTTRPVATYVYDDVAGDNSGNILATAAAQTTSSATWTGDTGTGPNGSTTWNQLKLSVTFTPQQPGYFQARVVMAKASYTVYVDPALQVA